MDLEGLTDLTQVGQGGFGVVYRAWQPAFRRQVAVKVLAATRLDERTRDRFAREAAATGQLSGHPHIVTVHSAGFTADNEPYLVMPFLAAGSLGDRVAAAGPVPSIEVTAIGVKVAGALATAHAAGVVHRDVKPDNILVDGYGEPVLTDFGIASVLGSSTTKTGEVTASMAYAAPEVLSGKRPGPLADVYSLAATLFALLRGRPPFVDDADDTLAPMLARTIGQPPPDLRPLGVPSALCAVLERGLAKAPEERWASAEVFGRALVGVQQGQGWAPSPLRVPGTAAHSLHATTIALDQQGQGEPLRPDAQAAYQATAPSPAVLRQGGPLIPQGGTVIPQPAAVAAPGRAPRRGALWALVGVGIVALAAGGFVLARLLTDPAADVALATVPPESGSAATQTPTSPPAGIAMPDVEGLLYADALTVLRDLGLDDVTQDSEPVGGFDGVAVSQVLGQDPPPGVRVAPGEPVRLVIAGQAPPPTTPTSESPPTTAPPPSPSPPPARPPPPPEPPPVVEPEPFVGEVLVLSTHPDARGIAQAVDRWALGINTGDYDFALAQFTPAHRATFDRDTYVREHATTVNSAVTVESVADNGADRLAAVSFVSEQAPGYGPAARPNETCTLWRVQWRLTSSSGAWLRSGSSLLDDPVPC